MLSSPAADAWTDVASAAVARAGFTATAGAAGSPSFGGPSVGADCTGRQTLPDDRAGPRTAVTDLTDGPAP